MYDTYKGTQPDMPPLHDTLVHHGHTVSHYTGGVSYDTPCILSYRVKMTFCLSHTSMGTGKCIQKIKKFVAWHYGRKTLNNDRN